jgi:2,4-diketo-3-deoxy-L-fuconate hydrolase
MKLIRYGKQGQEKPGAVDQNGNIKDISTIINDFDYRYINPEMLAVLFNTDLEKLPQIDHQKERIGPCINPISKIICIGLNHKTHSEQFGFSIPDQPIFFLKANSAVIGPYDDIQYPKVSHKVDWEAELAIVIGKTCYEVGEEESEQYILGYTCLNDLSDRYWQFEQGQHMDTTKGKSLNGFCPIGPCIVTKDEIPDPATLSLNLKVNGQLRQSFNASEYIFGPAYIVSYVSQFIRLYPGDVIAMGTGYGNAISWNDAYLTLNDTVEIDAGILGKQSNRIVAEVFDT